MSKIQRLKVEQVDGVTVVNFLDKRILDEPTIQAIADQLFSPFFSTKREGQGLGLTIIREILLNHGFSFSLKTYPEGITEFQINF